MLRVCIAICLAALLLTPAAGAEPVQLKAGTFEPARAAPDFTLRSSAGGELKLSDHRGKIVLLGFGFTNCPDVCPTTLAVLAQARKKLGPDAEQVQVIYISVDPERDTPERMKAYLRGFDPDFLGGTGTVEQIAAVRKQYGVTAEKKPFATGGYAVAHSSFVYLIDQQGKLRALMPYGHGPDDYVHDVRILLQRKS